MIHLRELCERSRNSSLSEAWGSQGTGKPQWHILHGNGHGGRPGPHDQHRPTTLSKEKETFISHKSSCLERKAQILFPYQNQCHEHLGEWDAVHYAFWLLVFRSHYFLSQSHCKETKLCNLDISQWRNVPLKAGHSLAAMGSEKSRFPGVRDKLIECINTRPTASRQEAQTAQQGLQGTHWYLLYLAIWSLYKPLDKKHVGSSKSDQRRPISRPRPSKNHHLLGFSAE